jgi:hypothetical protein
MTAAAYREIGAKITGGRNSFSTKFAALPPEAKL